ncbi:histone deacetylase [Desulfogranum marinum]|jgi:acetoin utilization deacetylase AcuC-like enzyme|uniref:histone deacetylase family protein n=1 Tax=Desulfogranum marinum TaxID=453220 RepID=UPI0029C965B6|nr:histone deacetylase [Desulfogranum marinum]
MGNDISVTLISDPAYSKHDTGGGEHPEIPERLQVIADALQESSLGPYLKWVSPKPATRSQLLVFHTEGWLFRFEEAVLKGKTYIDHPDNQVGYESYDIATLSAGAGLVGVDKVEADSGTVVFGLNRPPGHHAEPNMPFGFCFFNNCVIAARYWQEQYHRKRICILDFDAHHGNGIQTAFEEDPDAAYISIHEHPSFSYPGTGWPEENGLGAGKGTLLNLPLLPGAGDEQVRETFAAIVSFLERFQPEALIVGAGFDAHVDDDMSGLAFSTDIYLELGMFVAELAHTFTQGRLLSLLEGGYNIEKLGSCAALFLQGIVRYRQEHNPGL